MADLEDLPRPPPPIVGKVSHHSIQLYWEDAMVSLHSTIVSGDHRLRVCIQEQDKHCQWGNVYTGYAKSHVLEGLETHTEYRYRMRFMNDISNSEWSAIVTVSTTKEPLCGEHLHRAIMRQDIPELNKILDTGDVKIDTPDKLGFSPLMQASQKGYVDVVDELLKQGADVHMKNDAGKTSLMLASFAGQLESVKLLRKFGARYDDYDRGGSTSIHWAVDGGNTKLIQWMVDDGADVNMSDLNAGWTPLIRCASVTGKYDVASVLLINGASIDGQDKDGKTALMVAIINGHLDLLNLLLKRNANIKIKNEYGKSAYEMALSMDRRRIIAMIEEHCTKKGIKLR